ncbi:MAG: hypothetical protein WAM89_20975 [Terriglobales bacterium]
MHCSKPNDWTTVCKFSDGTVNVTSTYSDGAYYSDWYSAAEWARFSVTRSSPTYRRPSNTEDEAEAQSWHTQDGCEGDGFIWHDGACHAHASVGVTPQGSIPADAQGRCAIGTKYEAKAGCILHPTAEDKKTFGFIKDKQRQEFWAKEELRRRALEASSKVIQENMKPH